MSEKPEATRPFSTTFASIGAVYETDDLTNVQCRPTDEVFGKYCRRLSEMEQWVGKALPLEDVQSFVGLHHFVSRFVDDSEYYCNNAYRCLRVHTYTEKETAVVSHATIQDGCEISQLIRERRLPGLTRNPVYWHPPLQGATSDASGSSDAQNKGWGVCIMGYIAYGAWSQRVRDALSRGIVSISPLELLSCAVILHTAYVAGELPEGRRIVLRNDNVSAVQVINSGKAYSEPMLQALRVLRDV